ncbi:MAG: lysophospholipid acyltransferase family protein [Proteobacteria bacterium]|nr:lysophospholipid acyltransferase family protein [Pseudomonadota bacterium]
MARVYYYGRVVVSGIAFLMFGLGGLLLSFIMVPVLYLVVWNSDRRAVLIRGLIHHAFRLFIEALVFFRVITYTVKGFDKLDQPGLLIVANHPTIMDVVFLVGFINNAVCLVKQSLFTNPFMGFVIRGARYINNDRPQQSIEQCVQALHDGLTTIVFPEGTRTARGKKIQLHRGAAYVALHSHLPLTPVSIRCVPGWLTKEDRWYEVPELPIRFEFSVGEDLSVQSSYSEPTEALRARHATAIIRQTLFGEVLAEQPGA